MASSTVSKSSASAVALSTSPVSRRGESRFTECEYELNLRLEFRAYSEAANTASTRSSYSYSYSYSIPTRH